MEESGGGVIVIGAGGHALVSIEVLRSVGNRVLGCLSSDGVAKSDVGALGVEMLGVVDDLAGLLSRGHADVFVAVGTNRDREEMVRRVDDAGARLVTAISPQAFVSSSAEIAPGVLVMPGAVINALTTVATAAIVNTGACIDHECRIGAFAHIGPGVALGGETVVGEGVLVGIGACIAPRRTIGAWATVGAGSTVLRDVPGGVTVAGVPATALPGSERAG